MMSRVVSKKLTDVSEVLIASIIGTVMTAVRTSEMSDRFYETAWRNIPPYTHLSHYINLLGLQICSD
jgi:hypothetical protein